jgi:hypothetical protein
MKRGAPSALKKSIWKTYAFIEAQFWQLFLTDPDTDYGCRSPVISMYMRVTSVRKSPNRKQSAMSSIEVRETTGPVNRVPNETQPTSHADQDITLDVG